MHRLLAAECCPGELATAVRDHLVHIHVELRAAAGHPHEEWEVLLMLPVQQFIAGPDDQFSLAVLEAPGAFVGDGGSFLDQGIGPDHLLRHPVLSNAEEAQRPLGLSPPQPFTGNLNRSQTVAFFPERLFHPAVSSAWTVSFNAVSGPRLSMIRSARGRFRLRGH